MKQKSISTRLLSFESITNEDVHRFVLTAYRDSVTNWITHLINYTHVGGLTAANKDNLNFRFFGAPNGTLGSDVSFSPGEIKDLIVTERFGTCHEMDEARQEQAILRTYYPNYAFLRNWMRGSNHRLNLLARAQADALIRYSDANREGSA